MARLEDHPRIRGEHRFREAPRGGRRGSSPHTRGAPVGVDENCLASAIIPAYAGSTRFWCRRRPRERDHPRIRGEHQIHLNSTGDIRGSSPHTRGARRAGQPGALDRRIIPAYAGSTAWSSLTPRLSRDHPRIRGEHLARDVQVADEPGSSPHTRGARASYRRWRSWPRIIPAYAGSTKISTHSQ